MIKRSELKVGQKVSVAPRDKRGGAEVVGVLSEILTNSETHPYGILVSLEDGVKGRVQKIISQNESTQKENSDIKAEPQLSKPLKEIIDEGEDQYVEYKTSMLWSLNKSQSWLDSLNSPDVNRYGAQTSLVIIAKVIASFLNSSGGCLLIGIKENKAGEENLIVGVESEFSKLEDPSFDGYRRFIVDRLLRPHLPSDIFNRLINYLSIKFEELEGKQVCRIDVEPSDIRVFLKIKGRQYFFIRVDATTREIFGEQILEYCDKRF